MSKRKKLAIYAALALLYSYIWFDGGAAGHVIVLVCIGTTLLFLFLHYAFSKAADKAEESDGPSPTLHT